MVNLIKNIEDGIKWGTEKLNEGINLLAETPVAPATETPQDKRSLPRVILDDYKAIVVESAQQAWNRLWNEGELPGSTYGSVGIYETLKENYVAPESQKFEPSKDGDHISYGRWGTQVELANPDAHLNLFLEEETSTLSTAWGIAKFLLPDPVGALSDIDEFRKNPNIKTGFWALLGVGELIGVGFLVKKGAKWVRRGTGSVDLNRMGSLEKSGKAARSQRHRPPPADTKAKGSPLYDGNGKKPKSVEGKLGRASDDTLRGHLGTPSGWKSPFVKEGWLDLSWNERLKKVRSGEVHESVLMYFDGVGLGTGGGKLEARIKQFNRHTGKAYSPGEYWTRYTEYRESGIFFALERDMLGAAAEAGHASTGRSYKKLFTDGIEGRPNPDAAFPVARHQFKRMRQGAHQDIDAVMKIHEPSLAQRYRAGLLDPEGPEYLEIYQKIELHGDLPSDEIARLTRLTEDVIADMRHQHPEIRQMRGLGPNGDQAMEIIAREGYSAKSLPERIRKGEISVPGANPNMSISHTILSWQAWLQKVLPPQELKTILKSFHQGIKKVGSPEWSELVRLRKQIKNDKGIDLNEIYWGKLYKAWHEGGKIYGYEF